MTDNERRGLSVLADVISIYIRDKLGQEVKSTISDIKNQIPHLDYLTLNVEYKFFLSDNPENIIVILRAHKRPFPIAECFCLRGELVFNSNFKERHRELSDQLLDLFNRLIFGP